MPGVLGIVTAEGDAPVVEADKEQNTTTITLNNFSGLITLPGVFQVGEVKKDAESVSQAKGSGPFVPEPRWGATLTDIRNGRAMLYGGQAEESSGGKNSGKVLGDVHFLDVKTQQWSTPVASDASPRCWHTATLLGNSTQVLVFGGKSDQSDDEIAESMIFDIDLQLWYPLSTSGQEPEPRLGHTATLLGNRLYLFGGSKGSSWFTGLHILDVVKLNWYTPVQSGTLPKPRAYHQAVALGSDKIVYFGGNGESQTFNDIFVVTVHAVKRSDSQSERISWSSPQIHNPKMKPLPRSGHIMAAIEARYVLIFGGWDTDDANDAEVFESDAKLLDTVSWTWEDTEDDFRRKAPRATGCGFCAIDKMLVVFGGQGEGPEFVRSNNLFTHCLSAVPLCSTPHTKRKGIGERNTRDKKPRIQSILHNCKRLTS